MSDSERVARKDWLGSLPDNDISHDGPDLETFAERYISRLLDGSSVNALIPHFRGSNSRSDSHMPSMLQGDDHTQDRVIEPNEAQDAVIFESIVRWFTERKAGHCQIHALVDYTIDERGGWEAVNYDIF